MVGRAVFFDANILFEQYANRSLPEITRFLENNDCCISGLSIHILAYSRKIAVPNEKLRNLMHFFHISPLDEDLLRKSILGPTKDMEDNIQLISAAENECDFFLTKDKKLLRLKYFGTMEIVTPEELMAASK